jgi:hypothetical protein
MEVAVNLLESYNHTFDRKDPEIIESIITGFDRSPYFVELKFYTLNTFLNNFEYDQIDKLLLALEKHLIVAETRYNYLVTNLNPIKTSVLLMELGDRIFKNYAITEFRV